MSVPREYFNQTVGDFRVPDSPSTVNRLTAQHPLQATTTPRKRVVLDYDSTTKEITTRFALKNSSNYAFAFKVHSSFESGYVAKPALGIVQPGEAYEVTILLKDLQSLGRDIEKDKFAIDLASVDNELTATDNFSYDEKRILFIGMSQAAKERLAFVAEEQKRNLQLDEEQSRQRRKMAYVGTAALAILGIVVVFVDLCSMSGDCPWEAGGY